MQTRSGCRQSAGLIPRHISSPLGRMKTGCARVKGENCRWQCENTRRAGACEIYSEKSLTPGIN